MKLLYSSPIHKFNKLMTLCTLGVTLLVGLPVIAVAQDAVMPSSRGDSESLDSSHKTHEKIYVNHTKWMVEYAENGPSKQQPAFYNHRKYQSHKFFSIKKHFDN